MCEKCAKVDEMIGRKFGKLTVLEREKNSKDGRIRYLCECECGNRKIIRKDHLLYNGTKSCGKCNEIKPGKKFGLLTVIKKSDKKDRYRNSYFECKCKCGNTTLVRGSDLKNGTTKSCGRCNEIKLGEKFGLLTVIKKSDKKDRYRNSYFECRCECGNTKLIRGSSLRNGSTKSCGKCWGPKPGEKFGLLTVIKKSDKKAKDGHYYFECRCECGNMTLVRSSDLKCGSIKSCGCLGSSSGEFEIYNFLDANFIYYIREKAIEKLVTSKGGHPRFDFELFDKYGNSFFLEFHGEQHYWPMKNSEFGENQRKETDPMKIKYCEENDITFHTIGFFEDTINSLRIILYFHELLSPEKEKRNRIVYKLKQTLFEDENGHLSIFSTKEDNRAAA